MKKFILITLLTAFSTALLSAQPYKLKQVWTSKEALKVPESVLYDSERDIYYISNINGNPQEKNNQGFITKMKPGGEIENMEWVTGLNAPKGMGIFGNKLYASDIDRVAEIDINSGKISRFYDVAGAKFLNDITVDAKGMVYISDSDEKNSVVYRLADGKIEKWLQDAQIVSPNGVYAEKDSLMVGSFGNNGLYAVSYDNKKIEKIADVGMGIDGLVPDGKGNYFVSDWQGRVALVTAKGKVTILSDTRESKVNVADIDYVISQKILLFPTFFDNRIVAYKVE